MKRIGENFPYELEAAGLLGLPFTWREDGEITWGEGISEADRAKVLAVYDAHDPTSGPPFADLQATKIDEINDAFSQAAAALTEGYPEAERMTWATQQQEALAWAEDENTPTPYLDGLADARGISPEEMRQKTLQQTQLFMQASQQLVGKRQRLRDAVYAAQTPEQLEDIKWEEDNNV